MAARAGTVASMPTQSNAYNAQWLVTERSVWRSTADEWSHDEDTEYARCRNPLLYEQDTYGPLTGWGKKEGRQYRKPLNI